ncbi:DNA mismatch repair endonuclease MutL [Marinicrinis lubricantis]|uniref:DNA mismatch repair protein MutL n=1 Tax=Marinicrinis lubricantis TaxID=2086470 RepID=A0ABW1ITF3_9BACL
MGLIRILDDHIANQIAAGEVVERPSSVVKELVENSIDAGSTKIDVSIEEGGLELIRVADNGSGMEADDCETAFERHATSKIATGRDLYQIRTLGFRGEALPSIAAVSKVELLTAASSSGLGRKLVIEGGNVLLHEESRAPKGTDIQVKSLFYNTPARLKYMKTIQTEVGHVTDYLYRLAMSQPQISFSLKHNGKMLFQTLGNGDLLQVIAAIYGPQTAKLMVKLEADHPDYSLTGYVGKPELTRANRSALTTVINGRYIRSYGLVSAALQGYHTLLPLHRFPLGVIQLQMEPSLIDVNVHPAKLEVRFSKEQELYRFVEEQVKRVLRTQVLIPQPAKEAKVQTYVQEKIDFAPSSQQDQENQQKGAIPAEQVQARMEVPAREKADIHIKEHAETYISPEGSHWEERKPRQQDSHDASLRPSSRPYASETPAGLSRSGGYESRANTQERFVSKSSMKEAVQRLLDQESRSDEIQSPSFPKLYPIGQMKGTYILAQNEEGLFIIDQHAAHERINYEYFFRKLGQPEPASQELLIPMMLEYTAAESELLQQRLGLLEQVGVFLEPFGKNAFKVVSYPHWLPKDGEQEVIEEMIEALLQDKRQVEVSKIRDHFAATCACKASIKANQKQTLEELEMLLDRLAQCRSPYTCPHGRPIVVRFSNYDLEKMFKRVM